MATQTQDEQLNGSGDPVAASVLQADDQASQGLRAPAESGSGTAIGGSLDPSFIPANQGVVTPTGPGVYVPSSLDPGDTPEAGDVDPGSTASADETGQGGNVWEDKKRKGLDWNG